MTIVGAQAVVLGPESAARLASPDVPKASFADLLASLGERKREAIDDVDAGWMSAPAAFTPVREILPLSESAGLDAYPEPAAVDEQSPAKEAAFEHRTSTSSLGSRPITSTGPEAPVSRGIADAARIETAIDQSPVAEDDRPSRHIVADQRLKPLALSDRSDREGAPSSTIPTRAAIFNERGLFRRVSLASLSAPSLSVVASDRRSAAESPSSMTPASAAADRAPTAPRPSSVAINRDSGGVGASVTRRQRHVHADHVSDPAVGLSPPPAASPRLASTLGSSDPTRQSQPLDPDFFGIVGQSSSDAPRGHVVRAMASLTPEVILDRRAMQQVPSTTSSEPVEEAEPVRTSARKHWDTGPEEADAPTSLEVDVSADGLRIVAAVTGADRAERTRLRDRLTALLFRHGHAAAVHVVGAPTLSSKER